MTRLWHAALMGTRGSAEWERDLVLVGPVEPAGPPGRPAAMPTAAFDTTRRAVRRVRLGSAVLVVLAASLVTGCSAPGGASRDTTGGSAGASTSAAGGGASANPSDADAIAHPTGPTDIVLRVGDEGGFMMMEAVMSRVPRFTLYGDGRALIAQDATTAKGQAGINGAPGQVLTETRLTEAQVQDVLRFALVDGMVGVAKESFPISVMDVPTTVIEIHAGGVDKRIKATGLGMDANGPDRVVLNALASLVQRLGAIPGDAEYVAPSSLAILAATEAAPGVVAGPWPWPDVAPAAFDRPAANDPFGFTRHVLTDAQASAVSVQPGTAGGPLTLKGPDGKTYLVVIRPALPDEAGAG